MTKRLTVKEAVEHFSISEKTVRRRVKSGSLSAEKHGSQWFILVNNGHDDGHDDQEQSHSDHNNRQSVLFSGQPDQSALVEQLRSEIQHLREQVDHLTQVIAMSQKNISGLTEKLDSSQQMIEDLRRRPWWRFWGQ